MRSLRGVVVALGVLLMAAPVAAAAKLPDGLTVPNNLDCRQTFASYAPNGRAEFNLVPRGHLVLHVDSNTFMPTSYDFDAFWLTRQARAGGWSWNGRVMFDSGPLALQREGWPTVVGYWHATAVAMPHDNVKGRTANLVLESVGKGPSGSGTAAYAPAQTGREGKQNAQSSYWYCGRHGVAPRHAFAAEIGRVQRVSGLEVQLPTWFEPSSQGPETVDKGFVKTLKKGEYTLQLTGRNCQKDCTPLGIFNAKRAPASELGHRTPVELARGVHGWYGSVGCGAGSGPDWGPVFCGMNVVVWHYRGVNYAIQGQGQENDQLIAYANETIKYG